MTTTASPETTRLEASALTLGYADTDVVRELDLRVPHGKVTVIVGANASGKSTLLPGLARLLRPRAGSVLLYEMTSRSPGCCRPTTSPLHLM